MSHHAGKLLGDWTFRNPAAEKIAAALSPELLALRTRRLVADVRQVHGVSYRTALRAVAMARKGP